MVVVALSNISKTTTLSVLSNLAHALVGPELTCNFLSGDDVPTPTLPLESILIRSAPITTLFVSPLRPTEPVWNVNAVGMSVALSKVPSAMPCIEAEYKMLAMVPSV